MCKKGVLKKRCVKIARMRRICVKQGQLFTIVELVENGKLFFSGSKTFQNLTPSFGQTNLNKKMDILSKVSVSINLYCIQKLSQHTSGCQNLISSWEVGV